MTFPADIWAAWDARHATPAAPAILHAVPAALPDPHTIPPRAWLYGTFLVRRFVSLLVAPGGVGKSAYALGIAAAMASGRPILGERVHHSVPAWVLNLEDPPEETDRRVAALMQRHRLPAEALRNRLFLHSGRQGRLCMARTGPDGAPLLLPDRDALLAAAKAAGIGLIVVDPFVKSHALDENDNTHMDAAATAWADLAEAADCAVLLVHHVRKGTGGPTDIDAARGGKALSDAARAAAVLSPMSVEEAGQLGIDPGDRWRHVRLDDAKANLAPRANAARWLRLESEALENGTALYPHGDHVAAIVPWKPATVWARLTDAQCQQAARLIGQGPEPGVRYTARRSGRPAARWAGTVLVRQFGLTEAQAAEVIDRWLEEGVLEEAEYQDRAQRKTRIGLIAHPDRLPPAPGPVSASTQWNES